ncbi:MAG: pyruvate dehydrogenase (acetyl-transferring) E1 component subunit alpha [Bacteroidetes bacterium]|nr:pyruvate dehydrogenase (acetyl-transferring) E1 component subunit alpha [Bacteroidota bacterium]
MKSIVEKHTKETYLHWYEAMILMRQFEERCSQLYIQQKFGGFCHLYIGQEAVLAGMSTAIEKGDKVITAYRDHCHPIALGIHPKYVMAELFGKKTGLSKGKGGSMHMFSKVANLFGGHAIVGAQVPLGTGIAFAEKYRNSANVTLCFLGDGAVRQGAFHESLNMAMLWKLPVVYIIENNFYAMGTSVSRSSNVSDLYKLGNAYDIKSGKVDGMKCESVHDAIRNAREYSRDGNGPVLLEVVTYRYKGHSMSDPAKYRSKSEVESFKMRDCIEMIVSKIRRNILAGEEELEKIRQKVKSVIDEAVAFAEESPLPEPEELYRDVYRQEDYMFVRE